MAIRRFDLRDTPQLQRFVIHHVRSTGQQLGVGSYGSVEKLKIDGAICAGKKLHNALVETGNAGVQNMIQKFIEECDIMSQLRHPHIVQFLGVCFLESSDLPVLVMEYLPICLDSLLETTQDIPLAIKCSILCDVSRGLVFLHSHEPPVIHRDLTARNVLLNSALVAKLADLGVARILNLRPGRLAATMTQTPGTLAYMPPEALEENPQYNSAIDMFSFGQLSLYALVQEFPAPTAATCMDPNNRGMIMARTETERRARYIEQLSGQLRNGHPLIQLVRECLENDPGRRPSANQVLSQLEQLKARIGDPYECMTKLDMMGALREKDAALREMATTLGQKDAEKEAALRERDTIVRERDSTLREKDIILRMKDATLSEKDRKLHENGSLLREKDVALKEKRAVIAELEERVGIMDAEIQRLNSKSQLRIHHMEEKVISEQCRNAPISISLSKAVLVGGKVYIGGGDSDWWKNHYIIQVYTPESDDWSQLPPCPVEYFAMATVDGKLLLAGGKKNRCPTGLITAWSDRSHQWIHPYPDMPTARNDPTAIGYAEFLVVAGGCSRSATRNAFPSLDTVEILDTSCSQWYMAESLPIASNGMAAACLGNTLYLVGGWRDRVDSKEVFHVSLPELISQACSGAALDLSGLWKRLPRNTPMCRTTAIVLHDSLLVLGGKNDSNEHDSSIYRYDPRSEFKMWVKVGDMPVRRSLCSCAVLPHTLAKLLIVGGHGDGSKYNGQVHKVSLLC